MTVQRRLLPPPRFWFRLHGWMTWPLWGFLTFLFLTGSLAAVSNEVVWLLDPAVRATPAAPGTPPAYQAAMDAALAAVPGSNPDYIRQRTDFLVLEVVLWPPGGGTATVLVDPVTAEVRRVTTAPLFQDVVRGLHGWLLMPWQNDYSLGYYAVSLTALPLLVAMGTGLVVYKRFWRGYLAPRLRLTQGRRVFWGDLHRLAGIWSVWFLALTGLTALWFLTQAVLWHSHTAYLFEAPPLPDSAVPARVGTRPAPVPADAAYATAQAALPGLRVQWFVWPEHSLSPYVLWGTGPNPLYNSFSYGVFINPWTGAVEGVRTPRDHTALQTLDGVADLLHYGTFGGLISKGLWAALGLILTALSVSGMFLWRHRTTPRPAPRTETRP